MTGLLGFSSGYHAMMDCDALLMLGTDFPYQQFYPKDATIIQVDLRGEQIGRARRSISGSSGTRGRTFGLCAPGSTKSGTRASGRRRLKHYGKARKGLDELATGGRGANPQSSAVRGPSVQ